MINTAIKHIVKTAEIPSFSTYEERIHPYIKSCFQQIQKAESIPVKGNNLIYKTRGEGRSRKTIALTAHLDKINHYGTTYPNKLPVKLSDRFIEGAMDDCAGLGILLAIAEASARFSFPDLLFFFSEMEESKGHKEHPGLLKNNGEGYESGAGARRISTTCLERGLIPDEIITVDTTPLFKGQAGVALYSNHWEYNDLDPTQDLKEQTKQAVNRIKEVDPQVKVSNNTNDYLQYGEEFNKKGEHTVVSVALEPAIYPYHQKGERVFRKDIRRTLNILLDYLTSR